MRGHQKALTAISLAALLIGSAVAVANAQNLKRFGQGGAAAASKGKFNARMLLRGLNLTDQQKEQAKNILSDHKADIKAVAQESLQARKSLREALAGGADQSALKAAYDKASAAGWNALMLRNQIGSEIKQILTPEQQELLQKRQQNLKKLGQKIIANRRIKKLLI
jgi:Spy/CpxP family protein refolding chaperone